MGQLSRNGHSNLSLTQAGTDKRSKTNVSVHFCVVDQSFFPFSSHLFSGQVATHSHPEERMQPLFSLTFTTARILMSSPHHFAVPVCSKKACAYYLKFGNFSLCLKVGLEMPPYASFVPQLKKYFHISLSTMHGAFLWDRRIRSV